MQANTTSTLSPSRRGFLKQSAGAAAVLASSGIAARSYAAENNTLKIALVGCGGRGGGAVVEALYTQGPTRLIAVADVFQDKAEGTAKRLSQKFPGKVEVTPDTTFVGFDAYKRTIDALGPGGVVLLATPPAFRPLHVEYAIEKGCHVFMEKSFGVDAPGARRILKAGEKAREKNLKIAGGLMSRHNPTLNETIQQIHEGIIGDIVTMYAYRAHGSVGYNPRPAGGKELAHQIRNYSCFNWMNGTFLLDWLIHNLDVCCWTKNAWPVSAQAQGGRQTRVEPDQLFDHYDVQYTFPDGTRLVAQGRHINNCWNFFGSQAHGTKGSAVLGEGITNPRIFKGYNQTPANQIWKPTVADGNAYQIEHDLLFDAIRNDKPYNESERCVKAAMTGIMGRMAVESGQTVTMEQAMASNFQFAPNLDEMTWESPAPVQPDAKGQYPIAMPGVTRNY
jgi:predicted dehydrogenase